MSGQTDEFDRPPDPALLAPAVRTFRGAALAPYSFARRRLSWIVLSKDLNPAKEVYPLAVIFALSLPVAEAMAYLYDIERFKTALFTWMEMLSDEDYSAALDLAAEITTEAKNAQVNTVAPPDDGLPKKNT